MIISVILLRGICHNTLDEDHLSDVKSLDGIGKQRIVRMFPCKNVEQRSSLNDCWRWVNIEREGRRCKTSIHVGHDQRELRSRGFLWIKKDVSILAESFYQSIKITLQFIIDDSSPRLCLDIVKLWKRICYNALQWWESHLIIIFSILLLNRIFQNSITLLDFLNIIPFAYHRFSVWMTDEL
jgi:hypothetical protein